MKRQAACLLRRSSCLLHSTESSVGVITPVAAHNVNHVVLSSSVHFVLPYCNSLTESSSKSWTSRCYSKGSVEFPSQTKKSGHSHPLSSFRGEGHAYPFFHQDQGLSTAANSIFVKTWQRVHKAQWRYLLTVSSRAHEAITSVSTLRHFSAVPTGSASSEEEGFWRNKHKAWDDESLKPLQLMPGIVGEGNHFEEASKEAGNLERSQWFQEDEQQQRAIKPLGPKPSAAPTEYYIPVKAYYIARSLDIKALVEGVHRGRSQASAARNNVIIRWPDRAAPSSGNSGKPGMDGVPAHHERFMVAFQYGSVVFFNFESSEQDEALELVTPFCTDHFHEARKDDYGVVLRPGLTGWSEGGIDHVMVKQLDTNNIRVISSVLGQSVALDHYATKVDEMVNTFSELNRGMEQTGTFTMKRKKLFQLVAAANTTLADVILRLGLLERSDTAWKYAHYDKIWEYLRSDFELEERFESLDFKLNIIQHNVRFFLDILQNRKSDTLEWIIILLIAGEICVSLYEIVHTAMAASAPHPAPAHLEQPMS